MHPEKLNKAWFGFFHLQGGLGAILGRSQGFLRRVDVEGVTWEVMWNTISLSLKEVSYINWAL